LSASVDDRREGDDVPRVRVAELGVAGDGRRGGAAVRRRDGEELRRRLQPVESVATTEN